MTIEDGDILGICPTCYLVVTKGTPNSMIIGGGGSIVYHFECEPNRMKFMRENEVKWKSQGQSCKVLRDSFSYSISELAEYLQVSESKLRKFESGRPVTHAKLLSMAYQMFFDIASNKMKSVNK